MGEKESEFEPEEEQSKEKEPTSQELVEALKEVLSEWDYQELMAMPLDEALGHTYTTLIVQEGWNEEQVTEFLQKKGILQAPKE